MEEREARIGLWFSMWLRKEDLGIADLFTEDAVYIESWGPEYHGAAAIAHWFREWNGRGTVVRWDLGTCFHRGDETVAAWFFANAMDDGREEVFEGLSRIRWAGDRIAFLQEFGSSVDRYDPYAAGPEPQFPRRRRPVVLKTRS